VNDIIGKKEIKSQFDKYSLFVSVKLLNPEAVGEDRVKTTASVNINNMRINYYQ